jgi:hypothetical protein
MQYLDECEAGHIGLMCHGLTHTRHVGIMEGFMHGTFDRSGESDHRTDRGWSLGLFLVPALLVIALIALAIMQPAASVWISEAAQAEFVGGVDVPDLAPTQLAQPNMRVRTVGAN